MAKRIVRAKVGKNLPEVLSRTLVKDQYMAVSELVCNSYDADAEHVRIDLNPNLESIVIKDDGTGMDVEGLHHFFRLGDSVKLEEPYSPLKHRRRIGRHGIATVLLRYLGDSFSVRTVHDGHCYIVDEGNVDGDISGQHHKVSKSTPNGTTVTVRGLHFKIERGGFDPNALCAKLQWYTPNVPDFDVFVDGKLVKKRSVVEFASVYQVRKRIDGELLEGRIYVSRNSKRDLDGIRIYVNGRAVGEPSMFKLRDIDERIEGAVQGEIRADFLNDIVTLDRSQFQEHPKLDRTIASIVEVLKSIKTDLDRGNVRRLYFEYDRIYELAERALASAEEQINARMNAKYTLKLVPASESGPIAMFDPETDTISINAESKMYAFLDGKRGRKIKLSEAYLRRAFIVAAAFALSSPHDKNDELARMVDEQLAIVFHGYDGISAAVNKFTNGRILVPIDTIYFNPHRLYDHTEIAALTGRPPAIIRLLHTCGSLVGSREHLFEKGYLMNTLGLIDEHVSCIELVDPSYSRVGERTCRGTHEIRYGKPSPTWIDADLAERNIPSNLRLRNVGRNHPMYFAPSDRVNAFLEYAQREGLKHG